MRELTKSITSFSWAMSLFGARQALTFLQQPIPNGDHPASRGFEAVTRTAGSSLDGWMRGVFEAGDRLQRSTVDLMFSFVTLGNGDLGRVGRATDRAVRATGGALQAAVPGIGRPGAGGYGAPGGPSGSGAPGGTASGGGAPGGGPGGPVTSTGGWGPMPPLPDVPELAGDSTGGCCG